MNQKTLEEIVKLADIAPAEAAGRATTRRRRLERLASLLERREGRVRLFTMMEYAPPKLRVKMREDDSPLTIAYQDPLFRREGLGSDLLGDGMRFFDLSMREAHHLLCDCHYGAPITSAKIAERARGLAQKRTFGEILRSACARLWPRAFA